MAVGASPHQEDAAVGAATGDFTQGKGLAVRAPRATRSVLKGGRGSLFEHGPRGLGQSLLGSREA